MNVCLKSGLWLKDHTDGVMADEIADIKKGQAGQYLKDTKQAAELHNQVSDTLGDKYQFSTPAVATGPDWLEVGTTL